MHQLSTRRESGNSIGEENAPFAVQSSATPQEKLLVAIQFRFLLLSADQTPMVGVCVHGRSPGARVDFITPPPPLKSCLTVLLLYRSETYNPRKELNT